MKRKCKAALEYEKDVRRALDLFLPKSTYLQKRFLDAVMFYMQVSGISFVDYLIIETKQIDENYKNLLPKMAKRKSKK